jgi:oligopeptide transport system substrate-binding protein
MPCLNQHPVRNIDRLMAAPKFFLIILAFLSLAGCGDEPRQQIVESGRQDKALYRVLDDEVSSLDPHKASNVIDTRVAIDLFQGLTSYGPDGQIVPGLAESWQVTSSGLQWSFKLRPLLTFSDGNTISANDVVQSLQRALDPKTGAPMAKLLFSIRNAEAVAAGTVPPTELGVISVGRDNVQIQLERPSPELLEILAHPVAAVVPVKRINVAGDSWSKPGTLVTSGPFQVVRHVLHSTLELEKNSQFFGASQIALERLLYFPMSDRDASIRKFRAGEVDVVQDFSRSQFDVVKAETPDAIKLSDYRGTYYFVFNMRKPPFDDARVRCALSMALDREILARKVVGMDHQPSTSIIPGSTPDYGGSVLPAWAKLSQAQRLGEAQAMLTTAGYSSNKPINFEIKFNSSEEHKRMALAMSQMWRALPVQVTLFNSEASVHFASLKSADYAFARSGWIADYTGPESFLSIYSKNAGVMNYSGFADADFDRLFDAALRDPNAKTRIATLRRAEQKVADACAVVPIYTYRTKTLVSPDVKGWISNVTNINPSRYLSVVRAKVDR